MERELIECFEKWIGQEMEDSCYEGEVIEGYHIKFYPEWSLPPHITLEMDMIDLSDAVRLSLDEWDRLKVIVDFVDSSGDWMRLSFDDFMRYAAEEIDFYGQATDILDTFLQDAEEQEQERELYGY